jgi:hypothetical protein
MGVPGKALKKDEVKKIASCFNTRQIATKWGLSSYQRRKMNEAFRNAAGPAFTDESLNLQTSKNLEKDLNNWIRLFKDNRWGENNTQERPIFNMQALCDECELDYTRYRYLIATVNGKAVYLLSGEDREKIAEKLQVMIIVARTVLMGEVSRE